MRKRGPQGKDPLPVADRFWSKVDKSGDCWLWIGSKGSQGYGQFFLWRDRDGRSVIPTAHQVSYWLVYGIMTTGHEFEIHHTCENKICVNPRHLKLVRGASHKSLHQSHRTTCNRGHKLEGDNLYVQPSTGSRRCKRCRDVAQRRWHMRRRRCGTLA